MTNDPVSGPIPRDIFDELVTAPYGVAAKTIRKFDPTWDRAEGEKFKWRVRFEREVTEVGYATVEAESADEAEQIAQNLDEQEILEAGETDNFCAWDVISAEPRP